MSYYKFHSINKKWRYSRRYLSIICGISFLIILLISVRIYQRQWNGFDDGRDRPDYCYQSIIRKFYMHDRRYFLSELIDSVRSFFACSPRELFAQDPIRSSFTYELSNKNSCSSIPPPHALIFVISKSINFGRRNAIRRTWGNFAHITSIKKFAHLRLKLLFLLDIDETSRLNINLEQSIYHDLVQVHLPQYYILSTHRDMAILHWTETYCSKALFTIKTDDDIFLNIFLLANVLNRLISNITIDSFAVIYGTKILHAQVVRHSNDPRSAEARYITTDDEYPCRYYPDYMSGFGYMITRNARAKLLWAFFRAEKLFHLSDVYVTGILPEYMDIPRKHLRLQMSSQDIDDCDSFFQLDNAFACASGLHYEKDSASSIKDVYVFERFNVYWKHVYDNRIRSIHNLIGY